MLVRYVCEYREFNLVGSLPVGSCYTEINTELYGTAGTRRKAQEGGYHKKGEEKINNGERRTEDLLLKEQIQETKD